MFCHSARAVSRREAAHQRPAARARRAQLPAAKTVDAVTLTLADLETMLREPVRDKRYLDTRLGPSVKAYLSWKENEAGASERTLDQYERDLARLCVMLAGHEVQDVTTDELR